MKQKRLKDVTITDIYRASGVSRATFYRLFDMPEDVLEYRCSKIFSDIENGMNTEKFRDSKDVYLYFVGEWMKNGNLLAMLVENGLTDLLYQQHEKHMDLIRRNLNLADDLTDEQSDCILYILTGIMPAMLSVWIKYGKTDSPSQLLKKMTDSLKAIESMWN